MPSKRIRELSLDKVETHLAEQRRSGRSLQTSNHYVRALKRFSRWLVRAKRLLKDPLSELSTFDTQADRRHDRRRLTDEEFARLVGAAGNGPDIEAICGYDRAIMYLLAAWTGYRRGELASLTPRSFDLQTTPATVTVKAAYTKNRRMSTMPLHTDLVDDIKTWLASKSNIGPDSPLLPLKTAAGECRRTCKMMRKDLAAARKAWMSEADTPDELRCRESSDFLVYCDRNGRYADFHATRHTFVTNLAKAGVPLAFTQKLARHSDPRLTANIYTHVDIGDQAASINCLNSPPKAQPPESSPNGENANGSTPGKSLVAPPVAVPKVRSCRQEPPTDANANAKASGQEPLNPFQDKGFDSQSRDLSPSVQVRPEGLEPPTLGSEDRCSIQLSYGRKLGYFPAVFAISLGSGIITDESRLTPVLTPAPTDSRRTPPESIKVL